MLAKYFESRVTKNQENYDIISNSALSSSLLMNNISIGPLNFQNLSTKAMHHPSPILLHLVYLFMLDFESFELVW